MYKLFRPLIFTQNSESMHSLILDLGEKIFSHPPFFNIAKSIYNFEHPALQTAFLGVSLKNPVSIPAGFDKSARMLDFWPALGLGFIEIGSVTARGGQGNPKPRMFRLPEDLAIVNRMGLNNIGADAMEKKLSKRKQAGPISGIPLMINIAKTHDPAILGKEGTEDFCYSFKKLHPFADWVALNVSCPNTAEGKTFEEKGALTELLSEIKKIRAEDGAKAPVLIKISPDLNLGQMDEILSVAESFGVDGYIIANCTSGRGNLKTSAEDLARIGRGGLSGEPIREMTTKLIAYTYRQLKRPCIVGLGGIASAEHAYEKIKAGASVVQLFNGLVYEGPALVKKINKGLVKLLQRDGFKNISEAVGIEAK